MRKHVPPFEHGLNGQRRLPILVDKFVLTLDVGVFGLRVIWPPPPCDSMVGVELVDDVVGVFFGLLLYFVVIGFNAVLLILVDLYFVTRFIGGVCIVVRRGGLSIFGSSGPRVEIIKN